MAEFWGRHKEESKKKKVGLLGDFSRDWQPDLLENIGLEPKVVRVFWGSFLLKI